MKFKCTIIEGCIPMFLKFQRDPMARERKRELGDARSGAEQVVWTEAETEIETQST